MNSFYCNLCQKEITTEGEKNIYVGIQGAFDHYRLLHPDLEFETWPDGRPVVEVDSGAMAPEAFEETK